MTEWVSIREFARRDKCSHPLVLTAISRGDLKTNDDGKLDASLAGTGWRFRNRHKAEAEIVPPVPEGLATKSREKKPKERLIAEALKEFEGLSEEEAAARARQGTLFRTHAEAEAAKEMYVAMLKKHEYNEKTGLVVPIENVEEIVAAQYATVRTKLLAMPTEQAARVKRCKTVAEVQAALLEAVTEALEELSSGGVAGAIQAGA